MRLIVGIVLGIAISLSIARCDRDGYDPFARPQVYDVAGSP